MLTLSVKAIPHFRRASLYIVWFHLSSIKSDSGECENKNLRRRPAARRRKFRSDWGEVRNLNAHRRYKPGTD